MFFLRDHTLDIAAQPITTFLLPFIQYRANRTDISSEELEKIYKSSDTLMK
jgi:hypothetical protein|nr:MAG TPA: hypothetical protein [Caudoviricetes sp.]